MAIKKCKEEMIFLKCDCGCSMFVVEKTTWDDGDIDYNISSQDSRFDHNNQSLKSRIKNAFKILFGKPVYYSDIYIDKENKDRLIKFSDELNKILK